MVVLKNQVSIRKPDANQSINVYGRARPSNIVLYPNKLLSQYHCYLISHIVKHNDAGKGSKFKTMWDGKSRPSNEIKKILIVKTLIEYLKTL